MDIFKEFIYSHFVIMSSSGSVKLIPTVEIFYNPDRIMIMIEFLFGGIGLRWKITAKN